MASSRPDGLPESASNWQVDVPKEDRPGMVAWVCVCGKIMRPEVAAHYHRATPPLRGGHAGYGMPWDSWGKSFGRIHSPGYTEDGRCV